MIAKHPGECRPHAFQDATYGNGIRVMNQVIAAKDREPEYRCSVCCPEKVAGKKRGGSYRLSELIVVRR